MTRGNIWAVNLIWPIIPYPAEGRGLQRVSHQRGSRSYDVAFRLTVIWSRWINSLCNKLTRHLGESELESVAYIPSELEGVLFVFGHQWRRGLPYFLAQSSDCISGTHDKADFAPKRSNRHLSCCQKAAWLSRQEGVLKGWWG